MSPFKPERPTYGPAGPLERRNACRKTLPRWSRDLDESRTFSRPAHARPWRSKALDWPLLSPNPCSQRVMSVCVAISCVASASSQPADTPGAPSAPRATTHADRHLSLEAPRLERKAVGPSSRPAKAVGPSLSGLTPPGGRPDLTRHANLGLRDPRPHGRAHGQLPGACTALVSMHELTIVQIQALQDGERSRMLPAGHATFKLCYF